HELGHALGLGHNANPSSVMHATLDPATLHRTMTVADLNIPDAPDGADALHAAVGPFGDRPDRDAAVLEIGLVSHTSGLATWSLPSAGAAATGQPTHALQSPALQPLPKS